MKSTQIVCAFVSVIISVCVYIFRNNILIFITIFISRSYCGISWYNLMFENIFFFIVYCVYCILDFSMNIFFQNILDAVNSFSFLMTTYTKFISDPTYWPTIVNFFLFECYLCHKKSTICPEHGWTSSDQPDSLFFSFFSNVPYFIFSFFPLPSFTSICWKNFVLVCCWLLLLLLLLLS